jgi:hypothetical protein
MIGRRPIRSAPGWLLRCRRLALPLALAAISLIAAGCRSFHASPDGPGGWFAEPEKPKPAQSPSEWVGLPRLDPW